MFLWSMNKSISWKIQERSRNGKVIFIKMTVEIETYFNKWQNKVKNQHEVVKIFSVEKFDTDIDFIKNSYKLVRNTINTK